MRAVPQVSIATVGFAIALCVSGAVSGTSAHPQGDLPARLTRTFTIPPDKPVIVEVTVGEVTVAAWSRPELEVQIERRAEQGVDLARIEPRLEDRPDALVISARQADGPPDRALRTTIAIRVPAATIFRSIDVVDGRIALEGLRGSVTASLRQGPIDGQRLAGTVRLQTGFGSVEVRQAELTPGGLLRLRAFNGNATLRLVTAPTDARILALSFNGTITSDILLTMKDQFGPRFGEATLGSGDAVISMDAVYGDVVIRVERR